MICSSVVQLALTLLNLIHVAVVRDLLAACLPRGRLVCWHVHYIVVLVNQNLVTGRLRNNITGFCYFIIWFDFLSFKPTAFSSIFVLKNTNRSHWYLSVFFRQQWFKIERKSSIREKIINSPTVRENNSTLLCLYSCSEHFSMSQTVFFLPTMVK